MYSQSIRNGPTHPGKPHRKSTSLTLSDFDGQPPGPYLLVKPTQLYQVTAFHSCSHPLQAIHRNETLLQSKT